jgi:radical SAM protein with 4Fe4S-binding SPASM domain
MTLHTPISSSGLGTVHASPMRNYVIEGDAKSKELDVYHLIFAPTYACNLRCTHCYLPHHDNPALPEALALRLLNDWTDIVSSERGRFGGIFHLKGGEPLLIKYVPKLLDEIARKRALTLMITSNGTVPSRPHLAALYQCNEALDRNVVVNVSLDGASEGTHSMLRGAGTFDKTLSFIRLLRRHDVTVHLNSVIHAHNMGDIEALAALALNEGALQINFLPFVPKGYGEALWDWGVDSLQLLEKIGTVYSEGGPEVRQVLAGSYADTLRQEMAGIQTSNECVGGYRGLFYVVPNGDVYSCPNLVDAALCVGNLHSESLYSLHASLRERVYEKTVGCGGCSNRYICKGESLLRGPSDLAAKRMQRLGRLQERMIALSPLPAPTRSDEGVSYCFSRNL